MKFQLLADARIFVSHLKQASDDDLNAAFQVLAGNVMDSKFIHAREPLSGLVEAIAAEQRLRLALHEQVRLGIEVMEEILEEERSEAHKAR